MVLNSIIKVLSTLRISKVSGPGYPITWSHSQYANTMDVWYNSVKISPSTPFATQRAY